MQPLPQEQQMQPADEQHPADEAVSEDEVMLISGLSSDEDEAVQAQERCSICLDDLEPSQLNASRGPRAWGRTLRCCSKAFHKQCIQRWLMQRDAEISPYVGADAGRGHGYLQVACPTCNFGKGGGEKATQHTLWER